VQHYTRAAPIPIDCSASRNAISRNAGFNLAFSETQLVCDFAVTHASTHQTIDRKKDAQSFPKITHYAPAFSYDCVALMERDLTFEKEHVHGVLLGHLNSLAASTSTMIDDVC
jgi:hypothetical protein